MYVNVTNVEETGKVTWTVAPGGTPLVPARALRQFQPGAVLTASVTDPDGRHSYWYYVEVVPGVNGDNGETGRYLHRYGQ